jgi:hypothetical protein
LYCNWRIICALAAGHCYYYDYWLRATLRVADNDKSSRQRGVEKLIFIEEIRHAFFCVCIGIGIGIPYPDIGGYASARLRHDRHARKH